MLVGAGFYVLNQVRKPTRLVGRPFLWLMNHSHSGVTDWGLTHVRVEKQSSVLDVGCGGGRTIQKLAAMASEGTVFGVDYSAESVAAARAKNATLIKTGRVDIRQASVSKLPFPADHFDLVTAVETQYYWPALVEDMQEILRVLKPGGTLIVIVESYKGGKLDVVQRPVMKLLRSRVLSVAEEQELFTSAGYIEVQTYEERNKGWMCATGRKSEPERG
ncbi:MAG TPA: class I SAM-dependent methyltransferase [Pyrinomonadaceae bacterium]|nr:class I SAM-dependent methyltransferase [Pyrinomonadaceae bacterium]